MLKGLDTPVVFPVTSTLRHADYRVTVRIDRPGPDAVPPVFVSGPDEQTASKSLMTALEGVAPGASSPLLVSGIHHTQAWRRGNTMFVRSRATLVSPSWSGQASGDGYTAYQMLYAPVLMFSRQGALVNARIGVGEGAQH
jgi:intracellular multiplication protein IcmK